MPANAKTIRACYFLGNSELEWRDIPDPREEEIGPLDVLVKILYVGVCGTDIFGFPSKMPFFDFTGDDHHPNGRLWGHEFSCEVLAVGSDVKNVKVGDICAYVPYTNCFESRPNEKPCRSCRNGRYNACMHNVTQGVMGGKGGMRPYGIYPASKLVPVANTLPEVVAIVEMLCVSANAVMQCNIPDGCQESAAVFGVGPIGVGVADFLRLKVPKLFVVDLNDSRLKFCENSFGAIPIDGKGDVPALISAENDGEGVAYAVEATGANAVLTNMYRSLAPGGTAALVGIYKHDPQHPAPSYGDADDVHVQLPWNRHHKGQMTTVSCRNGNYSRHDGSEEYTPNPSVSAFDWVVECLSSGKIDPYQYIEKLVDASSIETAADFANLTRPDGTVKTVIKMDLHS